MSKRFWLTGSTTPYTPATPRGAWDVSAGADIQLLGVKPAGAAGTSSINVGSTAADRDIMLNRFVSAGAIKAGSLAGTANLTIGGKESNDLLNGYLHVHIYVTQGDSDNVRGTLLTDYIHGTEFTTTATGISTGAQTLSSVSVQVGDRLVVEVGYRANASSTTQNATINYGNTGTTDLAAGDTAVTTEPGWIDFSGADGLFTEAFTVLTDTFDSSFDSKWTTSAGTSVTGGRARINCTTAYPNIYTNSARELQSAGVTMEVPVMPVTGGGTGVNWSMYIGPGPTITNTNFEINYSPNSGNVIFRASTAGSDASPVTVAYNSTNHRWFRIRESSGSVYMETSPDNSTWTTQRTVTVDKQWMRFGTQILYVEAGRSSGTADYAEIDNINPAGGTAYTQTPADTEGLTDSIVLTRSLVQADSAGLTDSTSTVGTFLRTQDDPAGLTDSTSLVTSFVKTVTDSAGLTDTVAFAHSKVFADTEGLTDVASSGQVISGLIDNFDDNTIDTAKWDDSYGTHSETGGRARVACNTSGAAFATGLHWKLAESSVYCQVFPPAAGGATSDAYCQVLVTNNVSGTEIGFEVDAVLNLVRMYSRSGFSDPDQVTTTYNPTSHRWMRLSETGGTVTWELSPDGVTWSVLRTATTPTWVLTDVVALQLYAYRDGGTVDYAEFDNVNTVPSTAYTQSPSDTLGLTDAMTKVLDYQQLPSDTLGLTDSISIVASGDQTYPDTLGLTDSVSSVMDYALSFTDSAGMTDIFDVTRTRTNADNLGLTDSVSTALVTGTVIPRSTRPMVGLVIKLFDPSTGQVTALCPDYQGVSWTDEMSQSGTIGIKYPQSGVNANLLVADRTEGAIFIGTTEIPGTRFLVAEQAKDQLDEAGGTVQINAPAFVGKRLEEAVVYPPNWPATTPSKQTFAAVTPGALMVALLQQAQARGALTNLSWDFTATVDSKGAAWTQVLNLEINVGENYRAVVAKLVEMALVDWKGQGRQFRMFNFGTMGTDLSTGANVVALHGGRDFMDAPENRSVLGMVNAVLSAGEEGTAVAVTDSVSIGNYGRIEGYVSSSGVKDTGTLTVIGQAAVVDSSTVKQEFTHKVTFSDPSSPVPYNNYVVGDTIRRYVGGTSNGYLVRQFTFDVNQDGEVDTTITLNDKFYTQDVLQSRKVAALSGGSSSSASAPADQNTDTVAPNTPTGLLVTSSAYVASSGATYAAVNATWVAPATNADGSTVTDLDHYEVQWKYSSDSVYNGSVVTGTNSIQFSGVLPGRNIDVRVAAVDRNSNRSPFTAATTHLTASDSTPPPVPSTPVVTSPQMTLRAVWDGLASGGGAMSSDFWRVEVHVSTVNAFTPSSSTLVDYLPAAGAAVLSGLVAGTTYYVKFISVDTSGNKSAASAQGSAVVSGISLGDTQFRDADNLIEDGSFELPGARASRTPGLPSRFSFDNTTANHGTYSVKIAGLTGGAAVNWTLQANIPAANADVFYWRLAVRRDAAGNGSLIVTRTYTYADGTSADFTTAITSASIAAATWVMTPGVTDGTTTAAASGGGSPVVSLTIKIGTSGQSAGNWWFDQVELRHVLGTVLIQDLAVTNAKIGSVSAGKITVGTLTADITLSARIKTADTGARVEINSAGLQAYNSGGTQTVNVSATDGSVTIIGQLKSGTSGRRLEINPSATLLPEIRFYPNSGTNYAFINSISSGDGLNSYMGVNSGQFTALSQTLQYRLYMTDTAGCYLETIRSDTQGVLGAYVSLYPDALYMGVKPASGNDYTFLRLDDDVLVLGLDHNTSDSEYNGYVYIDTGKTEIGFGTSGSANDGAMAVHYLGRIEFFGQMVNNGGTAPYNNQAIVSGGFAAWNWQSFGWGYGTTMVQALQVFCQFTWGGGSGKGSNISANSQTGFTFRWDSYEGGYYGAWFWCTRN